MNCATFYLFSPLGNPVTILLVFGGPAGDRGVKKKERKKTTTTATTNYLALAVRYLNIIA